MPKVDLQRLPHGEITGIQYMGENISEIIDSYFTDQTYVFVTTATKEISTRGSDAESIKIGDWIITDEGQKRIVSNQTFLRTYCFKEAPEGYKYVDLEKEGAKTLGPVSIRPQG